MSPKTLKDPTAQAIRSAVFRAALAHAEDDPDFLTVDLEEAFDTLLDLLDTNRRKVFLERHWDTLLQGLSEVQLSTQLQQR